MSAAPSAFRAPSREPSTDALEGWTVEVAVLWHDALLRVSHLRPGESFLLCADARGGERRFVVGPEVLGDAREVTVVRSLESGGWRFVFVPDALGGVQDERGWTLREDLQGPRDAEMKPGRRYCQERGGLAVVARLVPAGRSAPRPYPWALGALAACALSFVGAVEAHDALERAWIDDGGDYPLVPYEDPAARLAELRARVERIVVREPDPPPAPRGRSAWRTLEPGRIIGTSVYRLLDPWSSAASSEDGVGALELRTRGSSSERTLLLSFGVLSVGGAPLEGSHRIDELCPAMRIFGEHCAGPEALCRLCGLLRAQEQHALQAAERRSQEWSRVPPSAVGLLEGSPQVRGLLSPEAIRQVLQRHRPEVQRCLQQSDAVPGDHDGHVVLRFVIGSSGSVLGAAVSDSNLSVPSVASCVASTLRQWQFPGPREGGIAVVDVPYELRALR